jgi:hypothetical protein
MSKLIIKFIHTYLIHRRARQFGLEGPEDEAEEPIVDNPVMEWNEDQVCVCVRACVCVSYRGVCLSVCTYISWESRGVSQAYSSIYANSPSTRIIPFHPPTTTTHPLSHHIHPVLPSLPR